MNKRWPTAEEMFPSGIVYTNDYGPIPIDFLRQLDVDRVVITYAKPIRETIEKQICYTYYENGDLEVSEVYSTYPLVLIDGRSTLNVYAQHINNIWLNEHCCNNCEEGECENGDDGFNYSQL